MSNASDRAKKAWEKMKREGTAPNAREAAKKAWQHPENWGRSEPRAEEELEKMGEVVARRGGWPDFMVKKDGRLAFYEIKKEGDAPKEHQRRVLNELRRAGFETHVWVYHPKTDSFEDVQFG